MNMHYSEEEIDRGDYLHDQRRDEKMEEHGTKQNPIQITYATQSPEQEGLWCQYPDGLLVRIDKGVAGQGYDLSEEETRDTPLEQ